MWEFVPSSHHKPTHFRLLHLFVQCSVNDFKSELFFPLFTLFPVCPDVPRAFLPCLAEAVDVNLITGDVIKIKCLFKLPDKQQLLMLLEKSMKLFVFIMYGIVIIFGCKLSTVANGRMRGDPT